MLMWQNKIKKSYLTSLGYDFIDASYLPKGKNEYYLRNMQNRSGIEYRQLSAYEIEVLVRNGNTSDNWKNILVSKSFNAELVKNCKFYGLVRIGKLEPYCLEFSDFKVPVGLYNSTIISCDFGDNVCIDNVNYLSHYILGSEIIINNVNELVTTNKAKFGNGIIKEGETEANRIWLEVCNENGGRSILPFNGMLPGDAFLWSKYRDDEVLLNKLMVFTQDRFTSKRGYYGKVGDRTVIKNTDIIKDVWIGEDAYIKGANKLKNLTILSGREGKTQIGEGCEIVNGIISYGCRIFYGVKAVRFVMASHSQLKYGARLINSYLGNNATISCCEVLNSLIFPAHEQHHNNSFLCAALVMGQSNIAAGATIGSNHNSRAADGEIIAGRGFWPGLCVSLKHNSKFASYTIIAKGDYPAELNITIPFSLISNDTSTNELHIVPGFWFFHNMYALARNEWKYIDRDKRTEKIQHLEYSYLAPDTINEIVDALVYFEQCIGKAYLQKQQVTINFTTEELIQQGKILLENNNSIVKGLAIIAEGFENSKRTIKLHKVATCYHLYKELISLYATQQMMQHIQLNKFNNWEECISSLPKNLLRTKWINIGGELMPASVVEDLITKIKSGKIKSWEAVHTFYTHQSIKYPQQKLVHAIATFLEIKNKKLKDFNDTLFAEMLTNAIATKDWMTKGIYESRAKDYNNSFRKMVYDNVEEMNNVMGALDKNTFIAEQQQAFAAFTMQVKAIKKKLKLK